MALDKGVATSIPFTTTKGGVPTAPDESTFAVYIRKDGGAKNAVSDTPADIHIAGGVCLVDLTSTEMTADAITLEWDDGDTNIDAGALSFVTEANYTPERAEAQDHIAKREGTIYYVATDGDDANSGLYPQEPLLTVAAALAAASAGDQVHVAEGTYDEAGLTISQRGLHLYGEQGFTLGGGGGTCLTITANFVCVDNLQVKPQTGAQAGVVISGDDATLRNVTAEDCTTSFSISGQHSRLIECASHGHSTTAFDISGPHNECHDCISYGDANPTRGFYLSGAGADNNELIRCVSVDDATASFEVVGGGSKNALVFCAADTAIVDAGTNTLVAGYSVEDFLKASDLSGLASTGDAMTLEDDAITAATITTGAIDSDALAASAIAAIHAGLGSWYPVTITCTDGDGDPVAGINLIVWNTAQSAQASVVLTTDANGQVDGIGLPDGTYKVVGASNPAYDVTATTFTINGAAVSVAVSVSTYIATAPPSASYCTIFGFEETIGGTVATGTARVSRVWSPTTRGSGATTVDVVYSDEDTATLDANGRWELTILRGAVVDIEVDLTNGNSVKRTRIVVPSESSKNWRELATSS